MRRTILASILTLAACVAPREGVHEASALDAATATAMASNEVAKQKDEVVLAWGLEFVGDRAKLHPCSAEDVCGVRIVELPAKSVLSTKTVARTRPVGEGGAMLDEVDVVRVTIAHETRTSRGGIATDPARGLVVGGPTK